MTAASTHASTNGGNTVQSKIPAPNVNAEIPIALSKQHNRTTPFLLKGYAYSATSVHIVKQEFAWKGRFHLMIKPMTTQFRFPTRLMDTVLDKETEFDGSLPEYCPDVIRLIRVDCTPYIDGCECGTDKVHINGRVVYDVLYETDRKNKLRYCSFTQEFRHTAELPKHELENIQASCHAACSKITCKMLSPRRPVLRARLELHTRVCGETVVGLLSPQPIEGMFFRKKQIRLDTAPETVVTELRFDETLPLLQGEKNIGEIIFGCVALQPPQVTVTEGCAIAKTNAVVKVLYEAEDAESGYCMSSKTVPLSVSLEAPAIREDKRCTVALGMSAYSVLPELDQYGESRLLKAEFSVNASATLIGCADVEVADDLFSTGYADTVARTEMNVPTVYDIVDRSFTVDLKVPAEEPPFTALYDTTVRAGRVRATPAEGGVELNGTLTVSVLGDSRDGILHRDYTEDFVQFVPVDLPRPLAGIIADVAPFDVLPTLHADGSISARVICNAKIYLYAEQQVSFLSGISKQVELDTSDDAYTVAYFFPSRADDLWSVAKRYRIDPERLRASNPKAFDDSGRLAGNVKTITVVKG